MDPDEDNYQVEFPKDNADELRGAVNSAILDYYKKDGRKRGLEQYFSLATAAGEVRDPSSSFWRRLKAASDSSSSGEKTRSLEEVCRISITCSLPDDPHQDKQEEKKSDYESPPIVSEDIAQEKLSDNESVKSEAVDVTLDTSVNKVHSPTSSVTSQRKFDWDSLADVGYSHSGDKKAITSSLSTLEREVIQQYTSSDPKHETGLGDPTAHSTLITPPKPTQQKNKAHKKSLIKKSKHYQAQDKDIIEVNVPESSSSAPISVNLTKHISFNVERDGGTVDVSYSDANTPNEAGDAKSTPESKYDKQVQTSLLVEPAQPPPSDRPVPVLISLNTLKHRLKRRKLRKRKKSAARKNGKTKSAHEKSADQLSEAESFEYMPGHMYDQNKNKDRNHKTHNSAGNKSSLESSGDVTTESSRNLSFTKDLDRSIKLLNAVLERHHNDSTLKKRMVKEIVQGLLTKKYRDDDMADSLLYGLRSHRKDVTDDTNRHHTTTSTSDANNTGEKYVRPKKSILRNNVACGSVGVAAGSSQFSQPDEPPPPAPRSDSEGSSKGRRSSGTAPGQSSSEGLYQKYLDAVRSERAYNKHLRDKEMFLRQKLVGSDCAIKQSDVNLNKLNDMINDLTRNNYDDGSGDASKLEGFSGQSARAPLGDIKQPRSHSVFTLSSSNSRKGSDHNERESRKLNLRKRLEEEIRSSCKREAMQKQCCCPVHRVRYGTTDSSIQVNIHCNEENDPPSPRASPRKKDGDCDRRNRDCRLESEQRQPSHVRKEININCACQSSPRRESERARKQGLTVNKCLQVERSRTLDVCSAGVQAGPRSEPSTSCCVPPLDLRCEGLDCSRLSQSSQTDLKLFGSKRRSDKSESSISRKSTPRLQQGRPCAAEATRAVQTDISIDPQIADPSISDIRVVCDRSCVEVVRNADASASYKSSSGEVLSDHLSGRSSATDLTTTSRRSEKRSIARRSRSDHVDAPAPAADARVRTSAQGTTADVLRQTSLPRSDVDNYAIPLQGTNMTLMVSIGPTEAPLLARTDVPCQSACVGTDVKCSHKATSPPLPRDKDKNIQVEVSVPFPTNTVAYYASLEREPKRADTKFSTFPRDSCCTPRRVQSPKQSASGKYESKQCTPPLCNVNANTRSPTKDRSPLRVKCIQICKSKSDTDVFTHADKPTKELKASPKRDACATSKLDLNRQKSVEAHKPTEVVCDKSRYSSENSDSSKDAILETIKEITRRYDRRDPETTKKKRCVKELISILNYLLDTDGSPILKEDSKDADAEPCSSKCQENLCSPPKVVRSSIGTGCSPRKVADKGVQLSQSVVCESATSDGPASSDSATCAVLRRIRRECDRYHRRQCRCRPCPRERRRCTCDAKPAAEQQKKTIAYNLIIQPSDSFVVEPAACGRVLQDVVVKVPRRPRDCRSEASLKAEACEAEAEAMTVQEYLQRNRPDFISTTTRRQEILKDVKDLRARQRQSQRRLLRLQLERAVSGPELRHLAAQCGIDVGQKTTAPKFISEREMKQHSEKIYKTLPEVQRKKDELKKETIKKTNLLMASIFKKNLQKKALRGSVNISNYSEIIKI